MGLLGDMMLRALFVICASLLLSGCIIYNDVDRTMAQGGLYGAGLGAGIGALVGSSGGPPGAAVGAAIGAGVGGTIGYYVRPEGCYIVNRRGELWRVPCDARLTADACYVGNEIVGLRQVACPSWYYRYKRTRRA